MREKALRVAALGPGIVVATRGDRGSLAYDGKQFYIQNAIPCEIVDTMGAGDSFIAGFLMSWIQGDSIPNSMNAGAENAAITIGYSGGW